MKEKKNSRTLKEGRYRSNASQHFLSLLPPFFSPSANNLKKTSPKVPGEEKQRERGSLPDALQKGQRERTVFRGKGFSYTPQTQGQLACRQITRSRAALAKRKESRATEEEDQQVQNRTVRNKRKSAGLSGVPAHPRLPPPGLPPPLSRDDDVFLGEYCGPSVKDSRSRGVKTCRMGSRRLLILSAFYLLVPENALQNISLIYRLHESDKAYRFLSFPSE